MLAAGVADVDSARQAKLPNTPTSITAREREVLDLIARGLTNKQIAVQLHLTLRAIEDRRSRMMRRVGVNSLAELLALVQQADLGDVPKA